MRRVGPIAPANLRPRNSEHMMGRLIKLCVSVGVSLGDSTHRQALRLLALEPDSDCVVLYYHAVPRRRRVSFGRQMDAVAANRHAGSRRLARGRWTPGDRYVAVTFDDGFVSVVENALPELRSRRIPCTIFVPTGSLGTRPSWLRQRACGRRRNASSRTEVIRALSARRIWSRSDPTRSRIRTSATSMTAPRVTSSKQSKVVLEAILKRDVGAVQLSARRLHCTQP